MSDVASLRKPCEIKYENVYFRGEGNLNFVVVHCRGDIDQVVYRFRKSVANETGNGQSKEISETKLTRFKNEVQRCLDFSKHVLRPLVGSQFVCCPELVQVSPKFVQYVSHHFQTEREAFRLDSNINMLCDVVVKMPDLCFLPTCSGDDSNEEPSSTYSFEIKPKSGCAILCKDERGLDVCRYCLHQELYVKQGKYDRSSTYCPIDLFSGEVSLMSKALHGLFETPQNNFHVFRNGCKVYDCHRPINFILEHIVPVFTSESKSHGSLDNVIDVIIQALLYVPTNGLPSRNLGNHLDSSLPSGCILERVLNAQSLSKHSTSEVYNLYSKLMNHLERVPSDRERLRLEGPFDKDFLHVLREFDTSTSYCEDSIEHIAAQLMKFEISKAARECSIMVTLRRLTSKRIPSNCMSLTNRHGQEFEFKVSILDLDPKPLSKIPSYVQLEEDLIENYRQQMKSS